MTLAAGSRIGPYEIQSPIGAGPTLGEVYRARDTRLGREVAIKVLPEMFASDPERLARFEREAQVLASLNHPHIAAIYGFEDGPTEVGPYTADLVAAVGAELARPVQAIVLEFVEGPTLADPGCHLDVGRFEIAMNNAALVCRFERVGNLPRDGQCLVHREA